MQLICLAALLFLLPASAFAQCATGLTAVPVCQLTNPVITSPLTVTCSASANNNQCSYRAAAIGNPISYNAYSTTPGGAQVFYATASPPPIGLISFAAGNGTPGTYTFALQAVSTTGVSATVTVTATVTP